MNKIHARWLNYQCKTYLGSLYFSLAACCGCVAAALNKLCSFCMHGARSSSSYCMYSFIVSSCEFFTIILMNSWNRFETFYSQILTHIFPVTA